MEIIIVLCFIILILSIALGLNIRYAYRGEHGTQELESIAMGKPVLCYISHNKPHPVTNCSLNEIVRWIKYFQEYPEQIESLAVFQYNNLIAEQGTKKLINIYRELLTNNN